MLSFENFVKSMPPSLSEWKVTPSFCFAFKIPDDVTASSKYVVIEWVEKVQNYADVIDMNEYCVWALN